MLLELQGDKLVERGVEHYDIDIACLDITPLSYSDPAAKFAGAKAASTFISTLHLLQSGFLSVCKTRSDPSGSLVLLTLPVKSSISNPGQRFSNAMMGIRVCPMFVKQASH